MDFQRLYIDSRDREIGGTASEFDISLANNIVVPVESVAILDCVLIPNSWYSVEKNKNDALFIREYRSTEIDYYVATVAQGYYDVDSFATAVAAALNAATNLSNEYTASFDAALGRIVLSNPLTAGHSMTVFT